MAHAFSILVLTSWALLSSASKDYRLPGYSAPRKEYTEDGEYWNTYEGLLTIPPNLPVDVKMVHLQWNAINVLPIDWLQGYDDMEGLDIRSNDVELIEDGAFNGLVNLKVNVQNEIHETNRKSTLVIQSRFLQIKQI